MDRERAGLPGLLPNDSARMLIAMMTPSGAELARRWVTALMAVPEGEREAVVAAVERQIAREFGGVGGGDRDGAG